MASVFTSLRTLNFLEMHLLEAFFTQTHLKEVLGSLHSFKLPCFVQLISEEKLQTKPIPK